MSTDRINIDVVRLTLPAESGGLSVVESIGVSHLEEHLRAGFGEDVPAEERAQRVSSSLLNVMTKLSTDPEYSVLAELDPLEWLPHWLKLTEPVVAHARTASGYVHRELTDRENNEVAARKPLSPDFQYIYSLFDLSSFVVASELGLEHPGELTKRVDERSDKKRGRRSQQESEIEERRKSLDVFASNPGIPAPHRRRVKEVRRLGEQLLANTLTFPQRLVNVSKLVKAAE